MPGTTQNIETTSAAPYTQTSDAAIKPILPENSAPLKPSMPASKLSDDAATKEAKQLKAFVSDDRHFSMVRNFRLADLVTVMNGVCGSLSVFNCGNYLLTSDQQYLWKALAYPLAGMFFDLFDGKVARWRNEASMLGQELDSLADSLSFGVAPAFCAYCIGLRTTLDTLCLTVFICCGIARLARFNATVAFAPKDETGKAKFFEGLPIPTSLGLVTLMSICVKYGHIEGPGGKGLGLPGGLIKPLLDNFDAQMHWVSLVFLVWGMAFISKSLKVPKP